MLNIDVQNQRIKEKKYWFDKMLGFSNDINQFNFQFESSIPYKTLYFEINKNIFDNLNRICNNSTLNNFVILTSALTSLISKYSGVNDIILGVPIFKQENKGNYINTILVLRNEINVEMSFKNIIFNTKKTLFEAVENQNYPYINVLKKIKDTNSENNIGFDFIIMHNELHNKEYLEEVKYSFLFEFICENSILGLNISYNSLLYNEDFITSIFNHYINVITSFLDQPDISLSKIKILSKNEEQLFTNDVKPDINYFINGLSIYHNFINIVNTEGDKVAVRVENKFITYKELNNQSIKIAYYLSLLGVKENSIIGIITERSIEMIIGIMGILRIGAAYLPIDSNQPKAKLLSLINDSNLDTIISTKEIIRNLGFLDLKIANNQRIEISKTEERKPIENLDSLPFIQRNLIDCEKYSKYIGQALVKNSIIIQNSRGCPFKCAFCHKIWPKKQISRSAKKMFEEVQMYYNIGAKRFTFLDDIFNLDIKNTSDFFNLIIDSNINVHFLIIVRGDILTKDYIDLMVKAGVIKISFSLESASQRIQKLIKKNLNLSTFKENVDYLCEKYPHVILEMNLMHGFPSETEEEALETLSFIKNLKWIHFPYLHILKIYKNTEMEQIALENGVSQEAIDSSLNMAYHEIPETLPFPIEFTTKYQNKFFLEYFLLKERLLHVLPFQMKVLTEDEIVQKYNSYLPVNISNLSELLNFLGIQYEEINEQKCLKEEEILIPDYNNKINSLFENPKFENPIKILFLDLTLLFENNKNIIYDIIEPPFGLLCLLSYLNKELPGKVDGKIMKSRIDFNNYDELIRYIHDFKPNLICIRSLTYFKNFFHETINILRQRGVRTPIFAGGPYITSDYKSVVYDNNVDLLILGEGELTLKELVENMISNNFNLPDESILKNINGLCYINNILKPQIRIIYIEEEFEKHQHLDESNDIIDNAAYVIYTSGSTGKPKGVVVTNKNVINLVNGLEKIIYSNYNNKQIISLLSPYFFDASIKQIFGALLTGRTLLLVPEQIRRDVVKVKRYLIDNQVNILDGTPGYIELLFENIQKNDFKSLQAIVVGGEPLYSTTAENIFNSLSTDKIHIFNVYGPTECTDVSSVKIIENTKDIIQGVQSIGKALENVKYYILNTQRELVPINVTGELYIGGFGLAKGYLNEVEKTSDNYIQSPFSKYELLYKTGDFVRWSKNEDVEYICRKDNQVKINGYRIELEEIESELRKLKNIKDAIVLKKKSNLGKDFLNAYIILKNDSKQNSYIKEISINYKDIDLKEFGLRTNSNIHLNSLEKFSINQFVDLINSENIESFVRSNITMLDEPISFIDIGKKINNLYELIVYKLDNDISLNDNEKERYLRQILLDEWGINNQEILKSKTVFVAGAGGIGSLIIQQMAYLGVGQIIICDFDDVELSNLNRQVMHDESRLGMNKAVSAAKTVERINSSVKVKICTERITKNNIDTLASNADIIFDSVDDLETKFILSDYAIKKKIPHALSAMIEMNSYAAILYPPYTPCFQCIHDRSKVDEINEIKKSIINYKKKAFPVAISALNVTTGFICNEVLKILLNIGKPAFNKFFLFNQKGSERITQTDGFKQMTFSFNEHFMSLCKEQGFDWKKGWRGNFIEELDITPKKDCYCQKKEIIIEETNNYKSSNFETFDNSQRKNSNIITVLDNNIYSIIALISIIKSRSVNIIINPNETDEEIGNIIKKTDSVLLITNTVYFNRITELKEKQGISIQLINIDKYILSKNDSIVILNSEPNDKAIIYYDVKISNDDFKDNIKNILRNKLHSYQIPSYFNYFNEFPMTNNGKIDKNKLYETTSEEKGIFVKPSNEIEKEITKIWSEVLNINFEMISIKSNFFEIGGHSLSAMNIVAKLNQNFNFRYQDIFNYSTIEDIAKILVRKDNFNDRLIKFKEKLQSAVVVNIFDSNQQLLNEQYELYKKELSKIKFNGLKKKRDYQNVLIVGSTGYLGIHLTKYILDNTDYSLYLIIRSASIENAKKRFIEKYKFYFDQDVPMKYWSRIILYNGDVSKNKLDLNDEVYNELYKKVDAIIHSAANVKHYGNYDDLYSSNVKTTLNLIEFSRKRKIDIHYISTISVIDGVTDTDYYLLNEMHYLNNRKSDNVYIRSKQEAESHLIEYREEGSIVNIYRVGNLVFNSKTGKFQENIQDNAFYTRLREFAMIGAVPIGGLTYDFSYVDAVAEAIITLFDKEKLTNNIFHLANNQNNVTLEQLADSFSKYGIIIKSMKGVDFIDFLIDKKEDKQLNQIIESIAAFSFNENEETNIRLMTTFDYTNRLLEKLGFKWPLFSSERIEKMVKHCKKVNFFN